MNFFPPSFLSPLCSEVSGVSLVHCYQNFPISLKTESSTIFTLRIRPRRLLAPLSHLPPPPPLTTPSFHPLYIVSSLNPTLFRLPSSLITPSRVTLETLGFYKVLPYFGVHHLLSPSFSLVYTYLPFPLLLTLLLKYYFLLPARILPPLITIQFRSTDQELAAF